jgi:hypothetical protein
VHPLSNVSTAAKRGSDACAQQLPHMQECCCAAVHAQNQRYKGHNSNTTLPRKHSSSPHKLLFMCGATVMYWHHISFSLYNLLYNTCSTCSLNNYSSCLRRCSQNNLHKQHAEQPKGEVEPSHTPGHMYTEWCVHAQGLICNHAHNLLTNQRASRNSTMVTYCTANTHTELNTPMCIAHAQHVQISC